MHYIYIYIYIFSYIPYINLEYWTDNDIYVAEVKTKLNHSMLQYMKGDHEEAKKTYASVHIYIYIFYLINYFKA